MHAPSTRTCKSSKTLCTVASGGQRMTAHRAICSTMDHNVMVQMKLIKINKQKTKEASESYPITFHNIWENKVRHSKLLGVHSYIVMKYTVHIGSGLSII